MSELLLRRPAPCECGELPDSLAHIVGRDGHRYERCRHSSIEREERVLGLLPNGEELVEESFFCGTCLMELAPQ